MAERPDLARRQCAAQSVLRDIALRWVEAVVNFVEFELESIATATKPDGSRRSAISIVPSPIDCLDRTEDTMMPPSSVNCITLVRKKAR
jgi:hypothetical protein